jgi:GT2 family glycosyltransferase
MIKFTIIIPVKAINDYVRETVPHIQAIARNDWELLVLPNEPDPDEWNDPRIRVVPSGMVGPAKKRDMGAEVATGEILVFLDDDSYPNPDLLDIANKYFADETVVALGGPAITPPEDSFWQRVSGAVFLSKFSGGTPERYVPVGDVRTVDDWPSVNLMVRKNAFLEIGGFNSPYWPGEDTKLCLDLIKKTKKKILYVPQMKVWHHRRSGVIAHLKQVGGYGLHRGYFAKKYPDTSRKVIYLLPSAFVIFVLISIFFPYFGFGMKWLLLTGWTIYGLTIVKAAIDMVKYEPVTVAVAGAVYSVATHIWYGIRFLQGLLTKNLVSRLR